MNILAVDTTGDELSLAIAVGEKILSARRRAGGRHDEILLPAVESLLTRSGLKLADLDAIAAASGPGRFTGIRIGMAYAAVAASALKIPALAVSRFEAAACAALGEKTCVALRGWKDEKYYQLFDGRGATAKPAAPPAWVSAADWERARRDLERSLWKVLETETSAAHLLGPAARMLSGRKIPRFEPLYLKPAGYEPGSKARVVR